MLIDQTQIRFDDFIASRADEVPSPAAGEAVAVSHRGAAVPGNAKAHQGTTHFLELALRAAAEAGDDAAHGEALPVNFVFMVDTSYSMHGTGRSDRGRVWREESLRWRMASPLRH